MLALEELLLFAELLDELRAAELLRGRLTIWPILKLVGEALGLAL
ncbi:hypothetical protein GCM10009022_17490 [Vreelandella titanicae]